MSIIEKIRHSFSFIRIKSGTRVIIPHDQQMIVKGRIKLEGRLVIKGRLSVI